MTPSAAARAEWIYFARAGYHLKISASLIWEALHGEVGVTVEETARMMHRVGYTLEDLARVMIAAPISLAEIVKCFRAISRLTEKEILVVVVLSLRHTGMSATQVVTDLREEVIPSYLLGALTYANYPGLAEATEMLAE